MTCLLICRSNFCLSPKLTKRDKQIIETVCRDGFFEFDPSHPRRLLPSYIDWVNKADYLEDLEAISSRLKSKIYGHALALEGEEDSDGLFYETRRIKIYFNKNVPMITPCSFRYEQIYPRKGK